MCFGYSFFPFHDSSRQAALAACFEPGVLAPAFMLQRCFRLDIRCDRGVKPCSLPALLSVVGQQVSSYPAIAATFNRDDVNFYQVSQQVGCTMKEEK